MSDPTKPHLVWIRTNRGPEPQRWAELNFGVNNRLLKDEGYILATHELTATLATLPLDELATLYPAPKARRNA